MIQQPKYASDRHQYYKPVAYEALTVDNTARTPTVPSGARMAWVCFRGGPVRMLLDGNTPTPSAGIPMYDGYEEYFSIEELDLMKLIREGATDGTVHFTYYQ